MTLKAGLVSWSKKLVYLFFILWVGGLTPLIYFEGVSSHFGKRQSYLAVNLLGQSKRSQKLAQVRAEILKVQNRSQASSIGPNRPVATQFFTTILNQSYLLAAIDAPENNLHFWGRILAIWLAEESVWLPLPEKPPPSFKTNLQIESNQQRSINM